MPMTTATTFKTEKKLSGRNFFGLGLLCFLALAGDMFVSIFDQMLWGDLLSGSWSKDPWYVILTHWAMTLTIWGIAIAALSHHLHKHAELKNIICLEQPKQFAKKLAFAIGTLLLLTAFEHLIEGSTISLVPQTIQELSKFVHTHGLFYGTILSLVQTIYYCFEAVLVLLLLACMQRAGELWFKSTTIPFGSLGLLITWGLGHCTKGLPTVLLLMAFTTVAGLLFVKNKKSVWVIYPFILFMFLL
jgi:hypothetical protein